MWLLESSDCVGIDISDDVNVRMMTFRCSNAF